MCFSFSGIALNHSMVLLVLFPQVHLSCLDDFFVYAVEDVFADDTNFRFAWINESAGRKVCRKERHAFITFDVCDFYPSISEDLLLNALDYSSKFTTITPQDRHIIIHAKKSLLYHQNSPWTKKNSNDMFDVTMGSYD